MAKPGKKTRAKPKVRLERRVPGAKNFGRFAAGLRVCARGAMTAQKRCAKQGDVFGAAFHGIEARIYGVVAAEAQIECDR